MKKHTKKLALLAAILLAAMSMTALSACGGGGEEAPVDNGSVIESSQPEDTGVITDNSADVTDVAYFKWEENEEGTEITITKFLGREDGVPTDVVIPSHINGKPVTWMEGDAMDGAYKVTSIVFPDTITTVCGLGHMESLQKVTLSPYTTKIAGGAFTGSQRLSEINLKETVVEDIGYQAFSNTALTEVVLPDTVIDVYASFEGIPTLKKMVIPGSLKTITNSMIRGSDQLAELVIVDGVETIESSAFEGCTALTTVTLPDGVTEIGTHIFVNSPNTSVIYKGETYENVGYQVEGVDNWYRVETEGNKALYKAVNGTELVEE